MQGQIQVADLFPFLLNCLTMCPPAVPSDIESNSTAENIIRCLCKIDKGDLDLPSNLLREDFFRYDPEYLPPGKSYVLSIYNMLIV